MSGARAWRSGRRRDRCSCRRIDRRRQRPGNGSGPARRNCICRAPGPGLCPVASPDPIPRGSPSTYVHDDIDQRLVDERVARFRDQTQRFLAGEPDEEEFRPLRLQNSLYVQRHAPMLRVAIP